MTKVITERDKQMRAMDSRMEGAFASPLSEILRDVEKEERHTKIYAGIERKPYMELEINRKDDARKRKRC